MALTVAKAQVGRGDEVPPNTTAVLVWALDRLSQQVGAVLARCATVEEDEDGGQWNAYEGETINRERVEIRALLTTKETDV